MLDEKDENIKSTPVYQNDLIGKKFHLVGEKDGDQLYKICGVNHDGSVHIERDDSWTFDAVGLQYNTDGLFATIEWDYSIGGRFTDEQRLQEHLKEQSEPTLKHLIDGELGEDTNICIYNKYGDFLCEGSPKDLRGNYFYPLIDEETAKVSKFEDGISEHGEKAINIHLSNVPWKDREIPAELPEPCEDVDKFYVHEYGRVELLYYNPNGFGENGQYVSDNYGYTEILEAVDFSKGSVDKFYEYLASYAKQYLFDNDGGVEFNAVHERYCGNSHKFEGSTAETMDYLVGYAKYQKDHENTSATSETVLENNQNNFMEGIAMENNITARVTPIENGTNLKGSATVTIGDQFAVHGIKVVQGKEGLFVSMPGEMSKNGKFYDTVLPKSKEAYANLEGTILNAYQDALKNGKQQKTDLNPTELSVKVGNFRENPYENNIKGDCQITINDMLVIKGVKVIVGKESGELGVALPSKQDQDGGYIPVANAITADFHAQIKTAVIEHYQNPPQTIGNTSYGKLADKSAGEETIHKTYNSQFAEKIGEQLNADNVKWSGKIEDNNKTVISVNKNDADKLENAVEKAKPPKDVKPDIPAPPEPPAKKTGGR